ncbi:MAG: hypothetical protein KAR54_02090 [Candidatus Pacebacteria bacterium]|nr:hypothetical protein [Candidatus Paceibacterota bacterium]
MKTTKNYIVVNNIKYPYSLTEKNKKIVFFKCPKANIFQEFLAEDIPNLLKDLPNLILS